jgi:hypothetical protein
MDQFYIVKVSLFGSVLFYRSQERLKLKINEQKSAVDRPWKLKFLGFSMYKPKSGVILIRLAPQTIDRVKTKIREITTRNKPLSMAERIERLNAYLSGWIGYFALADTLVSSRT